MRHTRFFAAAVLLLSGTAVAQNVPDESLDLAPVAPAHASPRATMQTFLEAFYVDGAPELATAMACLDLSGLPAEARRLKGRELAAKLKQVIDRSHYVRFEDIPDNPEGPPYVFLRHSGGEIVIDRTASGEWLFTAATVSGLDGLHRAVEGRDVVEGVEKEAPSTVSLAGRLRGMMPPALRSNVIFLEGWQWLGLIAIIFAGVVAGRVFVFAATKMAKRFLDRRARGFDPDILVRTMGPLGALVALLVWGLGIFWLGLPVTVLSLYYRAVRVVAIIVAVVVAYRVVDLLASVLERRAGHTETRYDDLLVPLIRIGANWCPIGARYIIAQVRVTLLFDRSSVGDVICRAGFASRSKVGCTTYTTESGRDRNPNTVRTRERSFEQQVDDLDSRIERWQP